MIPNHLVIMIVLRREIFCLSLRTVITYEELTASARVVPFELSLFANAPDRKEAAKADEIFDFPVKYEFVIVNW